MDKATITQNLNRVLEKTDFKNLGQRRQGKVRDIYTKTDKIILISTDATHPLTVSSPTSRSKARC